MERILGLILVGIFSLLAVVLTVGRPARTVLPLYAALVPIGGVVKLSIPLPAPFNSLTSLLGAAVISSCLAHVILYRRGRIPSIPVAVWLIFLTWSTASTFWAGEAGPAIRMTLIATPLVLLMLVAALLPVTSSDLDILKIAIVLGGAVVGAYALILFLQGSPLPVHGSGERFSLATSRDATNPNQLAASLLLPLILSIGYIVGGGSRWWRPSRWRLLGSAGVLLIVFAIVLSASRGGLIAAAVGFVLTLFYWWKRRPERRLSVWRTLAGTVVVGLTLSSMAFLAVRSSPEGIVARFLTSDPVERLTQDEPGTSGRAEIWTAGYMACETSCAWGAGLENFRARFNDIVAFSGVARNVGLDRPAHNVYLEVAVEAGFVGLTLLGLAFLTEWKVMSADRLQLVAPALPAALVALLVVNFFEGMIWFKYFWLVFVLTRMAEGVMTGPQRAETA